MNVKTRSFTDRIHRACNRVRIGAPRPVPNRTSLFARAPLPKPPSLFARPDWTPPPAPAIEPEPFETPERFGIVYASYIEPLIGLVDDRRCALVRRVQQVIDLRTPLPRLLAAA